MPTKITVGWDQGFEWTITGREEELENSRKEMVGNKLLRVLEHAGRQSVDGFVVIEREPQHFMQCLNEDQGWVLEKREGGDGAHFRAMVKPPKAPKEEMPDIVAKILKQPSHPSLLLTFEQVCEAMIAYAAHRAEPNWIIWQRVDV